MATAASTVHVLTLARPAIRTGVDEDGSGPRARACCTCGLDTGMVAKDDAFRAGQQHAVATGLLPATE